MVLDVGVVEMRTSVSGAIALQAQFSAAVKEGYQATLTRHQGLPQAVLEISYSKLSP